MSNTCALSNSPYFIWSQGHKPVNVCGAPPEQPVVAFDASGLGFYAQQVDGPPSCTYVLSSGSGYIQDVDGNLALVEDPETPQEWVIAQRGTDSYTVVKKETTLAWTDPGGAAGCERELHLTELNPIRSDLLFEFRPIF
ncbi:hypothetical protein V8B97DRAFT_2006391 [Scleroderma yunnanense]